MASVAIASAVIAGAGVASSTVIAMAIGQKERDAVRNLRSEIADARDQNRVIEKKAAKALRGVHEAIANDMSHHVPMLKRIGSSLARVRDDAHAASEAAERALGAATMGDAQGRALKQSISSYRSAMRDELDQVIAEMSSVRDNRDAVLTKLAGGHESLARSITDMQSVLGGVAERGNSIADALLRRLDRSGIAMPGTSNSTSDPPSGSGRAGPPQLQPQPQPQKTVSAFGDSAPVSFEFGPGSRVLDCSDGACAAGHKLVLWDSNGQANQQFTYNAAKKRVESGGVCLDVKDGSKNNGAEVRMWECNDHPAQQWVDQNNQGHGEGRTQLKNVKSGKCLDVVGGRDVRGSAISIYDCDKTGHAWDIRKVKSGTPAPAPKSAPAPMHKDSPAPVRWDEFPGHNFKWKTQIGKHGELNSKRSPAEVLQICKDRCAADDKCKGLVTYDPKRGNHRCYLLSEFGKRVPTSDRDVAAIKRR